MMASTSRGRKKRLTAKQVAEMLMDSSDENDDNDTYSESELEIETDSNESTDTGLLLHYIILYAGLY